MEHGVTNAAGRETRYYHALGRGCDFIFRCKDCRTLVLAVDLKRRGCCACGNKRVVEITTLSEHEQAEIASGRIDFPYRAEFLAEFSPSE